MPTYDTALRSPPPVPSLFTSLTWPELILLPPPGPFNSGMCLSKSHLPSSYRKPIPPRVPPCCHHVNSQTWRVVCPSMSPTLPTARHAGNQLCRSHARRSITTSDVSIELFNISMELFNPQSLLNQGRQQEPRYNTRVSQWEARTVFTALSLNPLGGIIAPILLEFDLQAL